ncbi:DUF6368 family protein [Streptomyces sp. NPDC048172]|uniref:DUF6368 family protein n=1 Tax=Streptomyces sp. NPDC048172 TaxID=3365505 RepID=UPI00372046BD
MSGPVLSIELAHTVPGPALQTLRDLLTRSSSGFEETRAGEYALHIRAESLGIRPTGDVDGRRPFLVSVHEAEHADEAADPEPRIGFTPTHAVDVVAFCNSPVDHAVTALLTAAVMDVVGGVATAELREDQLPLVAELPGFLATTPTPWPTAYGSAEFLRAWARTPGFHLLK